MSEEKLPVVSSNKSFPGFLKETNSEWNGPFCFIQGADTQLGMIEEYIEKRPNYGWEQEMELTRKAIVAVNNLSPKPRFFVVCGDLIHAMPGTSLRLPQEKDFIRLFKELSPDIPLICVCGNHDVGNTPTPDSIQLYREKFGDDYFTFYCSGVMFIVINSQYFEDASLVPALAAEQESWLEAQLEEAKNGNYKHVIIFQHIPWFLENPDESKIYFNLLPEIRQKWLPKFRDANVNAIFCGHWHGNSGGFYHNIELVVTSAIGAQLRGDKSGFRIVTLGEDSVQHKYYDLDEVPQHIDL
ncbi:serine/threonine-protein phosphatase CPPED1 [Parasteatoda tepidariorum]|uniref:Serine/threonine-protein phosphatase CPPED1 n=1 Tax=Parasteatoda tepidariorum TaxID=114398 RepID=A0A2L2YG05_PARTP|nr:serine/threonine-protein phosphatase CPPED1 [Parasteatoda tepidariorum]XP_042907188.1 serine/threonine-protein phosphatase CPPED1 [Parasteatoda tepidariorum]